MPDIPDYSTWREVDRGVIESGAREYITVWQDDTSVTVKWTYSAEEDPSGNESIPKGAKYYIPPDGTLPTEIFSEIVDPVVERAGEGITYYWDRGVLIKSEDGSVWYLYDTDEVGKGMLVPNPLEIIDFKLPY